MTKEKNIFIVLEGIDHCGKTSVCKKLHKMIGGEAIAFPDRTTETGKALNKFLKEYNNSKENNKEIKNQFATDEINMKIHRLFSENRYEKAFFIEETRNHSNIICDRYWISGAVYSTAKGLDYQTCKETDAKLPMPDLTFFIDAPVETTKKYGFGDEAHDVEKLQRRIYEIYKEIDEKMIFIKDGTIDQMTDEIFNYLKNNEYI